MDERIYWLGFSVFPGVGPKRFTELLHTFGTAESAWNASLSDLRKVLGDALTIKFEKFKSQFSLRLYNGELIKKDVGYFILSDPLYPLLLKQLQNPPFVLYIKGDAEVLSKRKTVGIVGTRKITSYGRAVTEMITGELVDAGCVIVSGLAMGVDSVAHKTTTAGGGTTIAVLGCGVDCCTPAANQGLYNSILTNGGAIVSEFPLSQLPTKGSFPSRNRIIAGLSQGVIVTEGAADSGALITADEALKINRKVFAVPGPITSSLSKGPNRLLSEGAKMVTSAQDIIKELGFTTSGSRIQKKQIKGETEEEQRIIDLLLHEPLHFDDIVKKTGFSTSQAGTLLSMMELKGMIKIDGIGTYECI